MIEEIKFSCLYGIAVDSKGLSLPEGMIELSHQFTVDSSRFSEMGKNGRVQNLIEIPE